MEAKTRRKIEAVLDEATELTEGGMDEYAAAREALTAQTTDVLKELATAAIVDVVRRRQRSNVLDIERKAVKPKAMQERAASPASTPGALTPGAAGIRKDSAAYWGWVRNTPEGAKYQAEEDAFEAERNDAIRSAIEKFERDLRIEWTAELLSSDFALADGTRVTWGEATVEQHEQRADLFQRNAVANAEGAARHLKAVSALKAAGVPTLGEMVGVAA